MAFVVPSVTADDDFNANDPFAQLRLEGSPIECFRDQLLGHYSAIHPDDLEVVERECYKGEGGHLSEPFLRRDQRLLDVLEADLKTLRQYGIDTFEIALFLETVRRLIARLAKDDLLDNLPQKLPAKGWEHFEVTEVTSYRGSQRSPFQHPRDQGYVGFWFGDTIIQLRRSDGETVVFNNLQVLLAIQGFYQGGKGRLAPDTIIKFFGLRPGISYAPTIRRVVKGFERNPFMIEGRKIDYWDKRDYVQEKIDGAKWAQMWGLRLPASYVNADGERVEVVATVQFEYCLPQMPPPHKRALCDCKTREQREVLWCALASYYIHGHPRVPTSIAFGVNHKREYTAKEHCTFLVERTEKYEEQYQKLMMYGATHKTLGFSGLNILLSSPYCFPLTVAGYEMVPDGFVSRGPKKMRVGAEFSLAVSEEMVDCGAPSWKPVTMPPQYANMTFNITRIATAFLAMGFPDLIFGADIGRPTLWLTAEQRDKEPEWTPRLVTDLPEYGVEDFLEQGGADEIFGLRNRGVVEDPGRPPTLVITAEQQDEAPEQGGAADRA